MSWGRHRVAHQHVRPDLGRAYRSSWEANVARVLKYQFEHALPGHYVKVVYEPERYHFDGKYRANSSYLPDWRCHPATPIVVDGTKYDHVLVELKGYMDKSSAVKLKRMAKHYPLTMVLLITEPLYRQIERDFAPLIPTWEPDGRTPKAIQETLEATRSSTCNA